MSDTRRLLIRAERLLFTGQPLPVDLQTSLIAAGIDVSALERKYS